LFDANTRSLPKDNEEKRTGARGAVEQAQDRHPARGDEGEELLAARYRDGL